MYKITTGIRGNSYEIDTCTGITRNLQTQRIVTKALAYPVRQFVLGGVPETLYFGSKDSREAYIEGHDYCDRLPRCKVYSDCIDG